MGPPPFAHRTVKLRTSHSDDRNADRPTPVHRSPKSLHRTGKAALPDHLKVQYKIKRTPMILMVPRTSKNWMCAFTAPTFQTMSVVRHRNAYETQSARTIQARLHTELSHANCRTRCFVLRNLFTPFGRIDQSDRSEGSKGSPGAPTHSPSNRHTAAL